MGGVLSDTEEQRLKLQTGLGRYQSRVPPRAFVCTSIRTAVNRPDLLEEAMEAKRDVTPGCWGRSFTACNV